MKSKELAFTNMVSNGAILCSIYRLSIHLSLHSLLILCMQTHEFVFMVDCVGADMCGGCIYVCVKARGQHQVLFLRIQSP